MEGGRGRSKGVRPRRCRHHAARGRNAAEVQGYNSTYARVRGLMKSDTLFDLEREPASVRDRYGPTDFGQHALIARRLIEAGVPMVKVAGSAGERRAVNIRITAA